MEPAVIVLMIPIVAIVCSTLLKMQKLKMGQDGKAVPGDLANRFEALEHDVRELQTQLGETQERLDFTERLLSKAREEKRIS